MGARYTIDTPSQAEPDRQKENLMKKLFVIGLLVAAASLVFVGCGGGSAESGGSAQGEGQAQTQETDATSRPTQAVATSAAQWEQALSAEGPWIIIATQDVTSESELVIEGEVYEDEGAEEPRRKLALYAQDSERNITDRYTLTAPRLIVRHENVRIQGGTFAGDVYIEAEGFNLVGGTIDGDLYFENESLRESFSMDDASEVTGTIEIGSVE